MKAAPLEHSNLQPFWYFSQHQPFLEPPQDDASPTCRRRIQWREEVIFGEGKATKHRVTSEETYIYVYHVYIYNSICILYYLLYVAIYIYISRTQIRKSDSLLATLRLPSCQSSQDIPTSQLKGSQATPFL